MCWYEDLEQQGGLALVTRSSGSIKLINSSCMYRGEQMQSSPGLVALVLFAHSVQSDAHSVLSDALLAVKLLLGTACSPAGHSSASQSSPVNGGPAVPFNGLFLGALWLMPRQL
jgi:hypothetical protein